MADEKWEWWTVRDKDGGYYSSYKKDGKRVYCYGVEWWKAVRFRTKSSALRAMTRVGGARVAGARMMIGNGGAR